MEKQAENLRIGGRPDEKDLNILRILQYNARMPLLEIARSVNLSSATVHERVRALEKRGVIEGYSTNIDYKKLGYGVTALISVVLEHPKLDLSKMEEGLSSIPEIVEAHNLTGDTDLLLIVKGRDIDHLKKILTEKVQNLEGVRRMSTSIVLDSPVPPRGAPI